jgi:hypothetical protein
MFLPMNKIRLSKSKSSFFINSTAPVPTAPLVTCRQIVSERKFNDPSSLNIYAGRVANASLFEYRVK